MEGRIIMANPDHPSPSERIVAGLAKLSVVLRHEAWRVSGGRGLTPTQSQILAVLAGSPDGMGVKEVSRRLAVTIATASESISALVHKGLVCKTVAQTDRRAVVLRLTEAGRREVRLGEPWQASMLEAVRSLPESEQAGMLRGLIGMIRSLQARGSVPTARMCVECTYFRPHEYPGTPKPHHCQFIDAPIGDVDLRLDCKDMQRAPAEVRSRLWEVFVNGSPLDGQGPGERRSPSKPRHHVHSSKGIRS